MLARPFLAVALQNRDRATRDARGEGWDVRSGEEQKSGYIFRGKMAGWLVGLVELRMFFLQSDRRNVSESAAE